jgi:long-chain fatty acid transport protein
MGLVIGAMFLVASSRTEAIAQSFGIELHNNLMPASGGMAGASISRPQDVQSAINGNPATLRQFSGTQFSFGGAWADANYALTQTAPLPLIGVDPYSAVAGTPGALLGNIGVTQDLDVIGMPATLGMGLMTNAGAGVDFRQVPESNGTSSQYLALDIVGGVGVGLTDRLSLGAAGVVGTSYIDGPFVDLGGMTGAYAFRATLGANYALTEMTSAGVYWQSKKRFEFEDAALFAGGIPVDLSFDHPANVGLGLANNGLMNGRLLLAVDALYKMYGDAELLRGIYQDQWCMQLGSQYCLSDRVRLRAGYACNENPMRDAQVVTIGGVTLPDGIPGIRYVQGQFAAITQHRLTGGVGIRDFVPGIDLDLFAGFAFDADDQFAATTVDVSGSYWVGFGTTWRFGGCPENSRLE